MEALYCTFFHTRVKWNENEYAVMFRGILLQKLKCCKGKFDRSAFMVLGIQYRWSDTTLTSNYQVQPRIDVNWKSRVSSAYDLKKDK